MLREIHEEPIALHETLTAVAGTCENIAEELATKEVGWLYFSGSGTSYHAALAAQYVASSLSNKPANSIPASEFDSWIRTPAAKGNALIVISQSGESVDALSAVSAAREKKMLTVAITNTQGSPLAEAADFSVVTRAGPERAITATKTFVCCLAAAYMLVLDLISSTGAHVGNHNELPRLKRELETCSSVLQKTARLSEDQAKTLAERYRGHSLFFVLGTGANYTTALEGALKLKESCHVMADGYAAREFLHGPMQLVDQRTPVIAFLTKADYETMEPLARSFQGLGAPVAQIYEESVTISGQDRLEVASGLSEPLAPLAFIVPIQLFAYHSAVARGLNPDKPTKLTKVVK
jgi:glucosamine--fructose-6-phosphate aminotransferase (isomerizing)